MPSGSDAFQRRQQQKEAQKATSDSGAYAITNDFMIKGGQTAVVRFLEQGEDLVYEEVHRVQLTAKSGRTYFKPFVCLNTNDDGTPCPACQHPNDNIRRRSSLGFHNVIERNAPVFQRDENKRVMKDGAGNYIVLGYEDQIALWRCSWTVHTTLREKDGKYRGLCSRDWEIKRTGISKDDTVYHIEPADVDAGATEMLLSDLTLAQKKYDLKWITKPLPFAELARVTGFGTVPGGAHPTMDRSAVMPTADDAFNGAPRQASAFTRG